MGKGKSPIDVEKKVKWDSKNDEARGLIRTSISPDLWFNLQGIDDPNEAQDMLENVFGKHNVILAHHLENKIITLNPNDFPCIEDYLSKFKTLTLLLQDYKIDMKE